MPSAFRPDSAAAYEAMNRMVALARAWPPLSREPLTAAPLETAMTTLPGSRGSNSASRVQLNTCCTSTSQLRLKVCQVCRWTGRASGAAPALRTSGDVEGVDLAVLDLLQHGLAGHSGHPGG